MITIINRLLPYSGIFRKPLEQIKMTCVANKIHNAYIANNNLEDIRTLITNEEISNDVLRFCVEDNDDILLYAMLEKNLFPRTVNNLTLEIACSRSTFQIILILINLIDEKTLQNITKNYLLEEEVLYVLKHYVLTNPTYFASWVSKNKFKSIYSYLASTYTLNYRSILRESTIFSLRIILENFFTFSIIDEYFHYLCKTVSEDKINILQQHYPNRYNYEVISKNCTYIKRIRRHNKTKSRKLSRVVKEIIGTISEKIINVNEINSCPICFEDSNCITECKHQFCNTCLNSWIIRIKSCPLCRQNIDIKNVIKIDFQKK